jgi:hypothetical protein
VGSIQQLLRSGGAFSAVVDGAGGVRSLRSHCGTHLGQQVAIWVERARVDPPQLIALEWITGLGVLDAHTIGAHWVDHGLQAHRDHEGLSAAARKESTHALMARFLPIGTGLQ